MKNRFNEIIKKMKMSKILEENKRFWEKCYADSNFDFKSSPSESVIEVIERLKKYNAKKVLDLGCGFGRWSVALALAGLQVKAIDISSEAIKKVQKWAEKEGLSIQTQVCSAQELVSEDESFDAIICNSILDHMPLVEAYKAMRNIKNILKSGGIAYISFDGLEKEDKKEFVLLDDETRRYSTGKRKGMLWRFYSDDEIESLCEKMEILEFRVKNGKRDIWVYKKQCIK